MTYGFLSNASALIAWARRLVSDLIERDAQLAARLAAIEARLTAGGL